MRRRIPLLALVAANLLAPVQLLAQDGDPVTAAVEATATAAYAEGVTWQMEEDRGPVGFDGLRLQGGAGLVRTLAPRTLSNDRVAATGYIAGMWSPNWIHQGGSDDTLDGGSLREGVSITKALKGFEFWFGLSGNNTWRVTDTTESLRNLGDIDGGLKYHWALSNVWSLAPYIHMRLLSPVKEFSTYGDTFSPEFGLALGWYGQDADSGVPLNWLLNVSYDFDRTRNLLDEATRLTVPATPFERINWSMSDFPYLRVRSAFEILAQTAGAFGIELLMDLPLVANDTDLAAAAYQGVVSWRKPVIRDWIMLHTFASAAVPNDTDFDVPQPLPWEAGLQLSISIPDGFLATAPVRRKAASKPAEVPEPVVEEAADESEKPSRRRRRDRAAQEEAVAEQEAAKLDAAESQPEEAAAETAAPEEPAAAPVQEEPAPATEAPPADDGSAAIDDGSESLGGDAMDYDTDLDEDDLYDEPIE